MSEEILVLDKEMNKNSLDCWIAPQGIRVPDFIICGAMKCGTTTVHHLLGLHPRVFIPASEINFFDMDDLMQHSDFFVRAENGWRVPDIAEDPARYWKWYSRFFLDAPSDSIVGEDSTCYLPSRKAPLRIAAQEKRIKLVVCLRHPTNRAYSQYWHLLRMGRALFSFEDTLRYNPHDVIDRSLYLPQIENLLRHIPRERVFFFVLEQFLWEKERVARRLCSFLGIPFEDFPFNALDTYPDPGGYPKSIRLQIFKNRFLRQYGNRSYLGKLPYDTEVGTEPIRVSRLLNKIHGKSNPVSKGKAPEMNRETQKFLDRFFERESDGINELVGDKITDWWFRNE